MHPSSSTAALTTVRAPFSHKRGLPTAPPAPELGEKLFGRPMRANLELTGVFAAVVALMASGATGSALGMLGAVALLGATLVSASRRGKRIRAQNQELLDAMESGRVPEAVEGFRRIATTSGLKNQRSTAILNLSLALSRMGRHDEALRVLAYADHTYHQARKQPYGHIVAHHTAFFLALWGDADGAELWLAEARRRGATDLLMTSWTPTLVLLRRRQHKEALAVIDAAWILWERKLNAASMRKVRVLRAFALHESGAASVEVDHALEGTRPFMPYDYEALASDWPELYAFVAAKGLR
jgi:tetratricopeptide (TPR) repeat protein